MGGILVHSHPPRPGVESDGAVAHSGWDWRRRLISSWSLAVGCWWLAVGCWVLGVGCWWLVVGYWLLVVGDWWLVYDCSRKLITAFLSKGFSEVCSCGAFRPCMISSRSTKKCQSLPVGRKVLWAESCTDTSIRARRRLLDIGFWMLGVGFWWLAIGLWLLDFGIIG